MNVGYWSATVLLAIMALIAAGGIASIVTGILGLVRARRYPAQKTRTALAVTGLVLGILVTFVVGGLAVLDTLLFVSCASSAAC
jgi:hypothetical protein